MLVNGRHIPELIFRANDQLRSLLEQFSVSPGLGSLLLRLPCMAFEE